MSQKTKIYERLLWLKNIFGSINGALLSKCYDLLCG